MPDQAQDRDPELSRLLASYLPRIRAFIRLRMDPALRARECSADLVQSVCVDLLRKQDTFEFRDEPRLRAWLFNAALHKVQEKRRFHGQQRRDVRREHRPAGRADQETGDGDLAQAYLTLGTPSRAVMGQELLARVDSAFDALPEHYREVLTLARIAELPHAEIAERTGKSVGAVRQILGRALVQLGDLLEQDA